MLQSLRERPRKKTKKLRKNDKKVLEIAIELARKGEGALFVVGDKVDYERLMRQPIQPFSVFDNGADKLLKSFATIDGAVIINKKGDVVSYGAMIKKPKAFIGFGTRHAAAMSASKHNSNISILCSEEERKVKIFKQGKLVMQVDPFQKNIEKKIPQMITVLETVGAGFIGVVGASALMPTLGISLIPGVVIFGASYLALKKIYEHMKKKL